MNHTQQIWEYITSPTWWFGVVFVSFFVNLLSAYSKPKIDGIFRQRSEKRQKRTTEEKKKFEDLVSMLKGAPERQAVYAARTNFFLLMSIGYDLAAVFVLVGLALLAGIQQEDVISVPVGVITISGGILCLFCVILGYHGFSVAIDRNRALRAAIDENER
jgi:hypothetical protein